MSFQHHRSHFQTNLTHSRRYFYALRCYVGMDGSTEFVMYSFVDKIVLFTVLLQLLSYVQQAQDLPESFFNHIVGYQ